MDYFPLDFLLESQARSLGDREESKRLDQIEQVKGFLVEAIRKNHLSDELADLLESLPVDTILAFQELSFSAATHLADLFLDEQTRNIPEDVSFEDFDTSQPEWFNAMGIEAIDGDTFKAIVWTNEDVTSVREIRVRLLGINAPEVHTRDAEEKRRGLDSKHELNKLVASQWLALYLPGKKSFNRELGWAFNASADAKWYGQNLSEAMVNAGCAVWKEY